MTEFSYQLYSSRNFGPLADTLRMVADLGYSQVEGYGGLYSDAAAVATLQAGLSETGLSMPTAHIGLEQIESDPAGVLSIAKTLGLKAIFVPAVGPGDRSDNAAGWSALGQRLAAADPSHKLAPTATSFRPIQQRHQ